MFFFCFSILRNNNSYNERFTQCAPSTSIPFTAHCWTMYIENIICAYVKHSQLTFTRAHTPHTNTPATKRHGTFQWKSESSLMNSFQFLACVLRTDLHLDYRKMSNQFEMFSIRDDDCWLWRGVAWRGPPRHGVAARMRSNLKLVFHGMFIKCMCRRFDECHSTFSLLNYSE